MIINTEKRGADGSELWLFIKGAVDSSNMGYLDKALKKAQEEAAGGKIYVDLSEMSYISSAGLRTFLVYKNNGADLTLLNASNEVYEIFEITGFTTILDIQKRERVVSLKGSSYISRGAVGMVFKIGRDEIIKVFTDGSSKEQIQPSLDRVKAVFLAGVPSPISYDVVQVTDYTDAIAKADDIPGGPQHKINLPAEGEGTVYGVIFEMMEGETLAKVMSKDPEHAEEYGRQYTEILKKLHSCRINDPAVPTVKELYEKRFDRLARFISDEEVKKLKAFVNSIPDADRCLHNDPHLFNVMVSHGAPMFIDLDDAASGHPVFDLVCHMTDYNAYLGMEKQNPGWLMEHIGMDTEKLTNLWHRVLETYTGTKDKEKLEKLEGFLRVFSGVQSASHLGDDSVTDECREDTLLGLRQYLFPILPDLTGDFPWPGELD